jgi:hypothetical protein
VAVKHLQMRDADTLGAGRPGWERENGQRFGLTSDELSGGDQVPRWLHLNLGPKPNIEGIENSDCPFERDSKVLISFIA